MTRKKPESAKRSNLVTYCTDEDADSVPADKLFHRYEKTYEGIMFDTLTCKDCGTEVKANPS